MELQHAPDIKKMIEVILPQLPFSYIDPKRIVCIRSFPKIWQMALGKPAYYIIEVLSQHFDNMSPDDKIRVIIHELMHIPKNFSGALVPHHGIHKRIDSRT